MRRYTVILLAFFIMIASLIVVNLTVSNILSTQGIDLQQTQQNLHDLQVTDALLEQKVLAQSSYTKIASEAATIGFVPDKDNISVVNVPQPLAFNP